VATGDDILDTPPDGGGNDRLGRRGELHRDPLGDMRAVGGFTSSRPSIGVVG
jgi:hypothetical protein